MLFSPFNNAAKHFTHEKGAAAHAPHNSAPVVCARDRVCRLRRISCHCKALTVNAREPKDLLQCPCVVVVADDHNPLGAKTPTHFWWQLEGDPPPPPSPIHPHNVLYQGGQFHKGLCLPCWLR